MYFKVDEFITSKTAERLSIDNTPNEEVIENINALIRILNPIREEFGQPIYINSGFRCKELNQAVNGSKTSQHLTGEAADITSKNNKRLWDIIIHLIENKRITVGQLINEKNLSWIHISLGTKNQILTIV